MTLSDLVVNLNLNITKFTNAMNTARRQMQQFSSNMAQASSIGTADALVDSYTRLGKKLHSVGLGFRDIARIASGILVSQTFYSISRSINEATASLWEFNESLDYAHVSYSALFNDSELASDFLNTLQQFSIDTIFAYSDLEQMSRKLLAYGIEYKNLMYIIEGLTNIGTMSGDSAALERLAVAIGQINAKGTLKAEEIRQLTNAYAPMNEILRDKFNLSDEDFGNIGNLQLPAHEVINAIVEYANEKFGDVSAAAMYTITGLNNRIVDSLKVMGIDIMSPITAFYKSLLKFTSEQLEAIYNVYKSAGLGGVFEYLIPSEEWQNRLRQLIANIKNFVVTIIVNLRTMWPVISQVFGGFIDALNVLLAVINVVGSGVAAAIQSISSHVPILGMLTKVLIAAAAAWVLFRVNAIAAVVIGGLKAVIIGVANAVLFLSKALVANPILTIFILLGAVLIGLTANANNANSAVSNLLKTLNSYSAGGDTADDILQVNDAINDSSTNSGQFWNEMEDGAEDTGDAIDEAGKKAKKASKSLLSFDEVFRLQDNAASDAGVGADIGDLSGIGNLADALSGLGASLIPEIPDLSGYANDFISTLYNSLWDALKVIASGGATGAVIGGLVGFAIGGLVTRSMAGALTGAGWGAKIGSIAGAGFAAFWTDTYKEMEDSLARIAVGGSIGVLIGGLVGLVIGAFATGKLPVALLAAQYGAAIGGLIGAGLGGFWATAQAEMSNAIEGLAVGSATGLLIGGLVGLLIGAFSTRKLQGALTGAKYGALIGALIGGALGGVFGSFEEELQKEIEAIAWGGAEGALVGGLAGMIIGAFATKKVSGALTGAKYGAALGSMIGVAISGILGESEDALTTGLENMFADISAASYGSLIGGLVGMIIGAVVGAFAGGVGAIPGAKAGATLGAALGALGGLLVSYLNNSGITESLSVWLTDAWEKFTVWIVKVGVSISEWWDKLVIDVTKWFIKLDEAIAKWWNDLTTNVSNWFSNLWKSISEWWDNLIISITKWFITLETNIANWWNNLITSISDWFKEIGIAISTWWDNLITNISDWFKEIGTTISTWWDNLIISITKWFITLETNISTWWNNLITNISDWFKEIGTTISTWWDNLIIGITKWFITLETNISTWWNNLITNISDWFKEIGTTVSTWWNNLITNISNWLSNVGKNISKWWNSLVTNISTWFSTLTKNIKDWWDNLFNPANWKSAWSSVSGWFSDLWTSIRGWFSSIGTSINSWWDGLWGNKTASVNVTNSGIPASSLGIIGHAKGGVFNREHIARFAEGNKAEAIIPLEDNAAMRPFVNAISDGIIQGLLPSMSNNNSSESLPPMYVGTLIADDRGLQQLYKKFELYEAKEIARKGLAT